MTDRSGTDCRCGVEGPFRDAREVRRQRRKPLQPTLRVVSEYVSTGDQLRRTDSDTRCAQIRCLQWQLFLTLFCVHCLMTTICLVSLKALVANCNLRMLCLLLHSLAYCLLSGRWSFLHGKSFSSTVTQCIDFRPQQSAVIAGILSWTIGLFKHIRVKNGAT